MIAGSSLIFLKINMKYVMFMCRTIKIRFQTDFRRENSASYYPYFTVAFDFPHHGHALVTLYVQFLCSEWLNLTGDFIRKIYAAS